MAMAKEKRIPVKEADKVKLSFMTGGANHQGVAAYVSDKKYSDIDDILEIAKEKGEHPFIVILDDIEDPQNFGAILRSCETFGVHGVVISRSKGAVISPAVAKSSGCSVLHINIAKVENLDSESEGSEVSYKTNLTGPLALIIGSEGKGIGRLLKEKCDYLVSIPIFGKINSLNASVAAAVMMYEVTRQRLQK